MLRERISLPSLCLLDGDKLGIMFLASAALSNVWECQGSSLGGYARRKHDREVTGKGVQRLCPRPHLPSKEEGSRQRPGEGQAALPSLTAHFKEEIADRLLPSLVLFSASGNIHRRDLCTLVSLSSSHVCLEREKIQPLGSAV